VKISIWLLTRERETWITGAEILGLAAVLVVTSTGWLPLLVGVPLLVHVGYKALTSLPMGQVPGRPEGSKQVRRNQDLRSWVVGFLNEMRRMESIAHQASVGGRSRKDIEKDLRWAKKRLMATAAEVAKAAGRVRPPVRDPEPDADDDIHKPVRVKVSTRAPNLSFLSPQQPGGGANTAPGL
jgi:hypothetical protein